MTDIRVEGEPIIDIDATPDEGYVLRILKAHLHNNEHLHVTDNTAGEPPKDLVCIAMNKAATERVKLLRKAIHTLKTWTEFEEGKGLVEMALGKTYERENSPSTAVCPGCGHPVARHDFDGRCHVMFTVKDGCTCLNLMLKKGAEKNEV